MSCWGKWLWFVFVKTNQSVLTGSIIHFLINFTAGLNDKILETTEEIAKSNIDTIEVLVKTVLIPGVYFIASYLIYRDLKRDEEIEKSMDSIKKKDVQKKLKRFLRISKKFTNMIKSKDFQKGLKKLFEITKKENFLKKIQRQSKEIHLKFRIKFLLFYGAIGLILGIRLLFLKDCIQERVNDERIFSGIFFIILALPVSFYLWYLRNNDKLESLKKQEESNNFNNFQNAIKLLLEKDNVEAKAGGLILLAGLRQKNLFVDEIDLITQNKALGEINASGAGFLKKIRLMKSNLSGLNLSNTILFGANLSGANLSGTILINTDLSGANLFGAILLKADLSGAVLTGAVLSEAILYETKLIIKEKDFTEEEIDITSFFQKFDFEYFRDKNEKYIRVSIVYKFDEYYLRKIEPDDNE